MICSLTAASCEDGIRYCFSLLLLCVSKAVDMNIRSCESLGARWMRVGEMCACGRLIYPSVLIRV